MMSSWLLWLVFCLNSAASASFDLSSSLGLPRSVSEQVPLNGSHRRPKPHSLVLSNLHIFNPPDDIDGLLPATRELSLIVPSRILPEPSSLTLQISAAPDNSPIIKLSTTGASFMALIRNGHPRFPEFADWPSSGFETQRYKNEPVPIRDGDIIVINIGHSPLVDFSYESFMEARWNGAASPDDFIEFLLAGLEQPFDQTIIVAEVMHRHEALSTFCYLEPVSPSASLEEPASASGWSIDFASASFGRHKRANLKGPL
jgi:hypothetical protein